MQTGKIYKVLSLVLLALLVLLVPVQALKINSFQTVHAGDTLDVFVSRQKSDSIKTFVSIPGLGLWTSGRSNILSLDIPADAEAGVYVVRVVVQGDNTKVVKHRVVRVV